ncbi:MAG: deoxyribodipyrimidine photo-lyase [Flammeovirgaceae bacterium]
MSSLTIFWFRRDLRLQDNAGLYYALKYSSAVLPVFIFDRNILDKLEDKSDQRVTFIYRSIQSLQQKLVELGSSLYVQYGKPEEIWTEIISSFKSKGYEINKVFANHDYEPYAKERDELIAEYLLSEGIEFRTYKDQCIFEKNEVLTGEKKPYTVFTPYSRKWKELLHSRGDFYVRSYPTEKYYSNFLKISSFDIPPLESMGFSVSQKPIPDSSIKDSLIQHYAEKRDFPAIQGTSRLSVHLRFGTVSIRALARKGLEMSETWLNELIWRDFYMMILYHFPYVVERSFQKKYEAIRWRNDEKEFEAWCKGQTGYPIVDAGMRELNATGFMHNRLRMITASFLTKHLLIDWRWGEAYFAKKLLDFDLAANNGGWQWAAGTGTDAQPYFRVFNPYEQTKKFDPEMQYIKKWVPEYLQFNYPKPIVEHKFARERAIETYKKALGE